MKQGMYDLNAVGVAGSAWVVSTHGTMFRAALALARAQSETDPERVTYWLSCPALDIGGVPEGIYPRDARVIEAAERLSRSRRARRRVWLTGRMSVACKARNLCAVLERAFAMMQEGAQRV